MYQYPAWEFNEIGDLKGLDHAQNIYVGIIKVNDKENIHEYYPEIDLSPVQENVNGEKESSGTQFLYSRQGVQIDKSPSTTTSQEEDGCKSLDQQKCKKVKKECLWSNGECKTNSKIF